TIGVIFKICQMHESYKMMMTNFPNSMLKGGYCAICIIYMIVIVISTGVSRVESQYCQPITIPECQNISYNMTIMPNFFNHSSQERASCAMQEMLSHFKYECSPDLKFFLCTLYAPVCTILDIPLPPCRTFCRTIKLNCGRTLRKFDFSWPHQIRCSSFPPEGELCVAPSTPTPLLQHGITTTPLPIIYIPDEFTKTDSSNTNYYCEPLRVHFCKALSYNSVILPNYFNQRDQTVITNELDTFWHMVESDCLPELKFLMCSIYAPACTVMGKPILPCKSLCQTMKAKCRRYMRRHNMQWPKYLRCGEFPSDGELCVLSPQDYPGICNSSLQFTSATISPSNILPSGTRGASIILPSTTTEASTKLPSGITTARNMLPSETTATNVIENKENVCNSITITLCGNLFFSPTVIAQKIKKNMKEQNVVGVYSDMFPEVKEKCQLEHDSFNCHLLTYDCNALQSLISCKSLCLKAMECGINAKILGYRFPPILHCNNNTAWSYLENDGICVLGNLEKDSMPLFPLNLTEGYNAMNVSMQVDQLAVSHDCEPLTVPQCKKLPYNMTKMPNYFNHTSQDDVRLELQQFGPLLGLENNCSQYLRLFLCSIYVPKCTLSGKSQLPCKSVCSSFERNCKAFLQQYEFTWPTTFNCKNFPPDYEECINSSADTEYISDISPGTTNSANTGNMMCEEITIPFCKGLFYNTTMMPNSLHHSSQDEAELVLNQFYPLVEMQCSQDLQLFLCSVYAPLCYDEKTSVLPCKSLCYSAKAGCEPIMNKFGFIWPAILDCDKYPESNEGAPCISATNKNITIAPLHLQSPQTSKNIAETCESLTIPLCKRLPYNTTIIPNLLNHSSQKEAELEAATFLPLIRAQCSHGLHLFVCSVFAPICHDKKTIVPCRSLCELVKSDCEPQMNNLNISWPKSLSCDQFPDMSQEVYCLSSVSDLDKLYPKPRQILTNGLTQNTLQDKCEPITIPLCKDLPYNTTMMPNSMNHNSQEEAGLEVHQFFPLVKLQCSPDLKLFLCSVYTPKCNAQNIVIPPCKSLCESAKLGCESIMNRFGFQWPYSLECEQFPESSQSKLCLSHESNGYRPTTLKVPQTVMPTTAPQILSNICEPIRISLCRDLPYNTTMMPNSMNHNSQEEAGLEVHQFFPLVKLQCSPELKLFLCSVYTPKCNDQNIVIPPCKSLCESAKLGCESVMNQFGFQWPFSLECEQFPESSQRELCLSHESNGYRPTTLKVPQTVMPTTAPQILSNICEPIRVSLCRDLPYNATKMPNTLNHNLQDEAALEVHQYFPLVKVQCSSDLQLFLCSVYVPECNTQHAAVPPCKSLCESAKSGCEPLMRKFGFQWPEALACEQFPESFHNKNCRSSNSET
ncbi:hypothetical protein SK128_012839, partial [Halocaridina rubra]